MVQQNFMKSGDLFKVRLIDANGKEWVPDGVPVTQPLLIPKYRNQPINIDDNNQIPNTITPEGLKKAGKVGTQVGVFGAFIIILLTPAILLAP